MITSDGAPPGAVFALDGSWRSTNVYVVGFASSLSIRVACALDHVGPLPRAGDSGPRAARRGAAHARAAKCRAPAALLHLRHVPRT
jgi:hypothetical protein